MGPRRGKLDGNGLKIIIGIDMETDVGSFTPFYEGVKKGTPLLLDLFKEKDIRGTFYFTGEAAKENTEIVRMVVDSGNETGCHSLYHETLGDELARIPNLKPSLPEEIPLRIEMATEWVGKAAGITPVSFRCPRLWGSTLVVNILEKNGYKTDSSYPMYFYRKQFAPYHPAENNWLEKGDMKILEIPNFADMLMKSSDPVLGRDRDQWPVFRTKGSKELIRHIDSYLLFLRQLDIPPVLCFYFHPWEFVPMKKKFYFGECEVIPDSFITKNCGNAALTELGKTIDYLKELGGSFMRADELAQ
jgi:peptidoglycan-N-acetylglucosamine deacetylase